MTQGLPPYFRISSEVTQALQGGKPVIALESTVITHGLPYPQNLELAGEMEREVRSHGAIPATIAVLDGEVHVGLQCNQLERLASAKNIIKISVRDFGPAIVQRQSGGTTVAATSWVANRLGIRVFATGGIGGVHRQAPFDISTDLTQLSITPIIVVCAGAKAILDLPATLEKLETLGVPVVGFQTEHFPAFYSTSSGLKTSSRADSIDEIVAIANAHWNLGLRSAVLVTVPPPEEVALPPEIVEAAIQEALAESQGQDVVGQAVTPFLLRRVSELTQGASLEANLALLLNNARLAAQVAYRMARIPQGS